MKRTHEQEVKTTLLQIACLQEVDGSVSSVAQKWARQTLDAVFPGVYPSEKFRQELIDALRDQPEVTR